MTEWRPEIVRIERVEKHPNADTLSIATVLGNYPVVVKTGQYHEGDIAAYISLDSIVPDIAEYYFLCPKAYEKYEENGEIKQRQLGSKYPVGQVPEKYRRVKAKRFFGIFSMGMLVDALPGLNVGDSIVDILNLKKYEEPEEEDNIVSLKSRGANQASPPKGWTIPYYDVSGLRKYAACLQEGEEIILTEKLNGSNAAFCHDGERLWSKSRNYFKKFDEYDPWWDIALRYKLEEKLAKYPMIVLFGELVGNVKNFRYTAQVVDGRLNTKIYFFDAWDTRTQRYLDYDAFVAIIQDLGLEATPELYRGAWLGREMYAYAEGVSILNPKVIREGFVLRPVHERYELKLDGRLQLKLISEAYSLAK